MATEQQQQQLSIITKLRIKHALAPPLMPLECPVRSSVEKLLALFMEARLPDHRLMSPLITYNPETQSCHIRLGLRMQLNISPSGVRCYPHGMLSSTSTVPLLPEFAINVPITRDTPLEDADMRSVLKWLLKHGKDVYLYVPKDTATPPVTSL
jgi:hypothetical protein